MDQGHVTVVGAGIVGICSAAWLQRKGFRVTVVDRVPPGEGCSFGNSGMLVSGGVVPYATPDVFRQLPKWLLDPLGPLVVRWSYLPKALPWLLRWAESARGNRAMEVSRGLHQLHGKVFENYEPLVKAAGAQDLVRRTGRLHVATSADNAYGTALAHEMYRLAGVRTERLGPDELRQLEPDLAASYGHGLYLPDDGQSTNSFRLVQLLAEQVKRDGGEILLREVKDFELGPDGPRRLLLDGEAREIDRLVIAAGAWSHQLSARLGTKVPLQAERGYHVMLPDPGIMPRRPMSNKDLGFAITPMENGLRFSGTVEIAALDAPADWRRSRILLEHGKRMFPRVRTEGYTEWMGCRPSLPDGLPVLDRSPRFGKVFYAFGNGHFGLTAGPTMGKVISELVAGAPPSIDLAPYRAARFGG